MKKLEFKFVVSGNSTSHGAFEEKGEGAIKIKPEDYPTEGGVQVEMMKEALETFLLVTQPAKKYKGIFELAIIVNEINEL
jgi:hypothetical protein